MRLPPSLRITLAVVAATMGVAACKSNLGTYVWVDKYPDAAAGRSDADYIIRPGDTIGLNVYEQAGVTTRARVRADGKISVALVGDVVVAGKRPGEAAADIAGKLKQYIRDPSVTVSLEDVRPISVSVVGEVTRAGIYQLEPNAGVLDALAASGGATEFADKKLIFVIRRNPSPVRIRFTYEALVHSEPSAIGFGLRSGDTVVVE